MLKMIIFGLILQASIYFMVRGMILNAREKILLENKKIFDKLLEMFEGIDVNE